MTTHLVATSQHKGFRLLVIGFLLFAGLASIAYFVIGGIAAHFLTQPQRVFDASRTPTGLAMVYEDVHFPARDGVADIAGWYIRAEGATSTIVMVHGRDASRTAAVAGNFIRLARYLHDAGYAVLMVDLRGHGQSSDARFTFGLRERNDVLGAVDWLLAQGVAPQHIGVLGLSLGAAAGIGATVDEPAVGALVTDSAFADINTLISQQWEQASGLPRPFLHSALFMARLLTGEDLTRAKPAAELSRLDSVPVLMIHCAADDYVPATNLDQLQAAYPKAETWRIMDPACLHSEGFNVDEAAYSERVTAFFNASLP